MRKNKGCGEETKIRGSPNGVKGAQWHWKTLLGGPECDPQEPLKKQAMVVQVCKSQHAEDGDSWQQAEAASVRRSREGPNSKIKVNGT